MSKRTKLLLTTAAILIIFVFWGLLEAYYDVYTTAGNQAETLTGRVGIWTYVLNAAMDRPWIGHGFDSMWKVIPPFGQFEARHAENELLQQFYTYGIAGIALLGGIYISLYRSLRRLQHKSLKIVLVAMLLFIVIRGLAEAESFDLLFPLWAIVLISMLVACAGTMGEEMAIASASMQSYPSNPPQHIGSYHIAHDEGTVL